MERIPATVLGTVFVLTVVFVTKFVNERFLCDRFVVPYVMVMPPWWNRWHVSLSTSKKCQVCPLLRPVFGPGRASLVDTPRAEMFSLD